MNRKIVLLAAALLICALSSAQHFDPERRHSFELSTGVPPLQCTILSSSSATAQMYSGVKKVGIFYPSLNIAYTYAMNERWDINIVLNACGAINRLNYYPSAEVEFKDDLGNISTVQQFDFTADPISSRVEYSGTMYTPMVAFRWKWLRKDNYRLYSSFGLGCLVLGRFQLFIPTPYLTPIGVNFGRGKFYGLAELNISCASTGLLAGVGYRF